MKNRYARPTIKRRRVDDSDTASNKTESSRDEDAGSENSVSESEREVEDASSNASESIVQKPKMVRWKVLKTAMLNNRITARLHRQYG